MEIILNQYSVVLFFKPIFEKKNFFFLLLLFPTTEKLLSEMKSLLIVWHLAMI